MSIGRYGDNAHDRYLFEKFEREDDGIDSTLRCKCGEELESEKQTCPWCFWNISAGAYIEEESA